SVGNTLAAIRIDSAPNNTVGGGAAGARNVISGGLANGIVITGATASGIVVAGNYIGADVTGTVALGNNGPGLQFLGGANNNRAGTDGDGVNDAAERNIISANASSGIVISDAGTSNNIVAGNYIGTDVNGNGLLPNTVSWWRAEGNALDSVDGNHGTLLN